MTDTQKQASSLLPRPPIVVVLGHVDHGKTTLLDYIRKSNVAEGEHGGITQAIGAYQIEVKSPASPAGRQKSKVKSDEEGRFITFIDTPGHEAFAKMRARGARVADIGILVVAADDSVKPQTIESIEQIRTAGIPVVVAINKVDLPAANIDRVKGDLAKHGVQLEGFGGDVPCALVSAKQGTGVSDLLDLILLVADMKGLTSDKAATVEAVVIETRVDKGKGLLATLVVKSGTLAVGSLLFDGAREIVKVRAMLDEHGAQVPTAGPSKPVEVLGFRDLPAVGTTLCARSKDARAPTVRGAQTKEMPDFLKPVDPDAERIIRIILKADTAGSLEAIVVALPKKVVIVQSGVGDITEADILSAKSTGAIVIGFGVAIKGSVVKLAETENVIYRTYRIIYELLDELGEVVAGLKEVLRAERELGKGQIIAEFPFAKDRVAGTKIASGRLARGDTVKIMRGEEELARAKIKSLRHGKEDITKAETGMECGILFDKKVDFTEGDGIIAFTIG